MTLILQDVTTEVYRKTFKIPVHWSSRVSKRNAAIRMLQQVTCMNQNEIQAVLKKRFNYLSTNLQMAVYPLRFITNIVNTAKK